MFCGNCGKEIIGNTKFCAFCGAEQNAVVLASASVPIAAEASENAPEAPNEAAVSVPASQNVSAPSVPSAMSAPSIPVPNIIPTNNLDAPVTADHSAPNPPTSVPAQTVVTISNEEKPQPERKYSLRHIVMCLAAAAVMAVTAGVFAGLYFSVI